jgi:hypothetical protein
MIDDVVLGFTMLRVAASGDKHIWEIQKVSNHFSDAKGEKPECPWTGIMHDWGCIIGIWLVESESV